MKLSQENASKQILLCTLGLHAMVVVQAFLSCKESTKEVHVFTTDNPKLADNFKILSDFFAAYPNVTFTLTAVKGLIVPNSSSEHEVFEEALFQWFLQHSESGNPPLVCLSGGTKTIPATMQKAAQYFSAADLFHVLIENPLPSTPIEAQQAIDSGRLQIVSSGVEVGWLPLRLIAPQHEFAIIEQTEIGFFHQIPPLYFPVKTGIERLLGEVYRRAEGQAVNVPFQSVALLPALAWEFLNSPISTNDAGWVQSLPKVELHCHLGGFATQSPLLDEVKAAGMGQFDLKATPVPPQDWPLPSTTVTLDAYMRLGDANGSALLKDPGCLKKQIELLYQHLLSQNIRYAEIRCSPDNYRHKELGRTAWTILEDIRQHFQQLMEQYRQEAPDGYCHVNLLVIATRRQEGDLSSISRHLALAITATQQSKELPDTACKIVGVDLAGYESKETRASYFATDFMAVHRCGLAVTAHAGENDDAEGIWQAVHALHARRLGHALHLWQAPDLLQTVIDRRIGIEMCPYANYQIKGFAPMTNQPAYPLTDYLRKGAMVTVNTDNIGISAANLTDNYLLLAKLCPDLTRLEMLQLIRNAIEVAFMPVALKKELINRFEKQVFSACINLKSIV